MSERPEFTPPIGIGGKVVLAALILVLFASALGWLFV